MRMSLSGHSPAFQHTSLLTTSPETQKSPDERRPSPLSNDKEIKCLVPVKADRSFNHSWQACRQSLQNLFMWHRGTICQCILHFQHLTRPSNAIFMLDKNVANNQVILICIKKNRNDVCLCGMRETIGHPLHILQ